jgi:hypothetical protein
MDLLELMAPGREEKSLDRLEAMLAQYGSNDDAGLGEVLERAVNFCEMEWGGYQRGLEALAQRVEAAGGGSVEAAMRSLRLREEGAEPGIIIRGVQARRERERRHAGERNAVVARYGSEEAAKQPTAFERRFIDVATPLAAPEADGAIDAFGPFDGWHLPWHPVPDGLKAAVAGAHPLPSSVVEARAECLQWEARLKDLEFVFGCPGEGSLPTPCAARRKVAEELWRNGLPAHSLADVAARLEYWVGRGGDDGHGYRVLAADILRLAEARPPESTGQRARRLKARNPDWSLARIGQELGISRQAVHKHLKA